MLLRSKEYVKGWWIQGEIKETRERKNSRCPLTLLVYRYKFLRSTCGVGSLSDSKSIRDAMKGLE